MFASLAVFCFVVVFLVCVIVVIIIVVVVVFCCCPFFVSDGCVLFAGVWLFVCLFIYMTVC